MQAGLLRHRISLLDVGAQATGRGGFAPQPVVVAQRIPAAVTPLSGTALMRALQIDPRSRYTVDLRYRSGVTARLKLVYHAKDGDQTFEIFNVNDVDERHREIVLLCGEAA